MSVPFNCFTRCLYHTQISGFNFVKNCCEDCLKEWLLSETYIAFTTVSRLEGILIEVLYAKVRPEQIRILDKLAFENYLRRHLYY